MFHRPKPSTPAADTKPTNTLTSILSAEQLLAEPKRQQQLNAIIETGQLKPEHFEKIGLNLIHQVAYYYQRLPEGGVYFSRPGGLLDHALSRTQAATKLLREYLLPPPDGQLSDEQKRWWYTLFSASLLRGIGRLCTDYHIHCYNIKGQLLKSWEPLFENIGQLNHYYEHKFTSLEDEAMKRRLTLLMAQKLMPEAGFAWIAENKEVLAVWLALLDEDADHAGALGAILDRADSIVIYLEIDGLPLKENALKRPNTGIGSFIDTNHDVLTNKEHAAGLEFMRWLQNKIEASHFLLNRAPIFAVPGGILICIEAFQLFAKEHVHYKNWHTVQQSFLSLKVHQLGIEGKAINKHEQGEGVLTLNSVVLPETVFTKDHKTGETIKTTATALAIGETGMRISNKGEWIIESQPPQQSLAPNTGRRGG